MTEISNIFDQLRVAVASRDRDAEMWIGQLELSRDEDHFFDRQQRFIKYEMKKDSIAL